ncbi:MAG: hypothetical protein FWC46_02105, partial [Actinomycetia bacterium]|nr:hypothetical protein [Actinomycetes bacterium]
SFGATSRGIAVGSTKAAVLAAYGADVDPADPDASTPAQIVAGTFAGGVVFLLDAAGTVTSIFVGASAE